MIWVVIAIIILLALALAPSTVSYQAFREEIEEEKDLDPEREEWLRKLEMCESSGNPNAVNPEDLDGTPSYGLLQFKPSTFEFFSKAYGIEGELMDPEAQRQIVRRMMDDPSVRWERQFPWCIKKIGLPPGVL